MFWLKDVLEINQEFLSSRMTIYISVCLSDYLPEQLSV